MALFREKYFDFVITDMNMPDGDGRGLARSIKEKSTGIPVILVTGGINTDLGEKDTPFDAVLFKPFTARDILQTIHRVYGRNPY